MAQFLFLLKGYSDTAADLAENVNAIGGKAMMAAVRNGLSRAGYDCDAAVGAEDWGWYVQARRAGRTYLCGGSVERDADDGGQTEAQVFLERQRSFADRLFGRNKPDPALDPGADLLAVLQALPGVSEVKRAA